MARPSRIAVVHATLVVFALLLIGQAARVQLIDGAEWADRARRQQYGTRSMVAPRGRILDASGNVLAESRELVRLSVAPREVRNPAALATELRKRGFEPQVIAAATSTDRKWVTLPGVHVASDAAVLTSIPGVHAQTVVNREYVTAAGIRRIVGALDATGRATSGIELALDSILAGDSTRATLARDARGRRLYSPDSWVKDPRAGANVTLTLNRALQEICERALESAIDSLGAAGGDIVMMNPVTGEILALASQRTDRISLSNTAVTEPFEPGSTLKPFIAAALFARNRARPDEIVPTYNGVMKIGSRTITDLRKAKELSLADVIRYSSNIGIVQFGARLSRGETFETLRDLGFGTPTGVPIPGEADGTLREPARWQRLSAASLAMGYEIAVTPLQLVTAYAVLANGGKLVQPHIVREIRTADGELIYQAKQRIVRRVFSEATTAEVRRLLVSVVEGGTAVRADIATFSLAGKSGTARRTEGGEYVPGNYTASFVGIFPAEKPQYVVLVKIDSPRSAFYGGEVAAPVSAVVLRAALAAQDAALDRGALASEERDVPLVTEPLVDVNDQAGPEARAAMSVDENESVYRVDPAPYAERMPRPPTILSLPFVSESATTAEGLRAVPDVSGLPTRAAVRALHHAGFRVTLSSALTFPTVPSAGTLLQRGSIVKLRHIP